ncbi:MAG: BrnT family toxin [Alphaproteobacteria bacterium]|nr:BrnT family toxin [Alphaproteobacteria bacterium]
MKIEFDPAKSEKNASERGLPFSEAEKFDYDTALRINDLRKDYGERRIVAYGYIGTRLHVLCFKPIADCHIRVISLRKANKREEKFYAENT